MRIIRTLLFFAAAVGASRAQDSAAPRNELAFGLGGLPSVTRSDSPNLTLGPGTAMQVNYGRRVFEKENFALYGEINFIASPLRDVASSVTSATANVASLYVTPGIRLKVLPRSRVSPWAAIGGGYADYEQSTARLGGSANSAPRELSRGVFDFGVGVDVRVWRWIALRGEARDFFSGSPAYNVPSISGGQNNVVALGAIVLRWH
jgi:hypothetical protein